ncbi:MAG TPA: L,D-transpeptidase family protein [Solirubrobacteraceae bacterium]|nr:L,D-transpeptidase family protein [Solirubrobacteraceae bacterium]
MHRRSLALIAILLVALLAGAGGVYAFDQGKEGQIAEGIKVNGVDVGGLSASQARTKLRAALLDPLNRPVTVRFGPTHQHYKLTPAQAQIGVDIDGSVQRALARSREGDIISRTWREVRGTPILSDLDAKVTYSKPAIRRLVARVQRDLAIEPASASVDLEHGSVDPKPSKDGRAVRAARLRRDLQRELLDSGARRVVRVRTSVVEPEVTTEELAKKYPAVLVVNRGAFKLTLYKNLKPAKTYGVAIGQIGLETPAGLYHIQNKAVNPAWTMPHSDWVPAKDRGKVVPGGTPENPLKARWLGIFDGAGIHGTDAESSIGTAASHGCVRMRIPDVIELYDQVPVGAPIYIA